MFSWVASELRFVEVPPSWRGWCRAGLAAQDVRIYQLRLMTISIHSSFIILNLKDGQFSRNTKQGEWTHTYIYIYMFFSSLCSFHDPTWTRQRKTSFHVMSIQFLPLRFTGYVSKYLSTLARSVRMTGEISEKLLTGKDLPNSCNIT